MPAIGPRCHELRVQDRTANWRILYRLDPDAVVIVEVFSKQTRTAPGVMIQNCRRRLRMYDVVCADIRRDR
jgi:phage-related protein